MTFFIGTFHRKLWCQGVDTKQTIEQWRSQKNYKAWAKI